MRLEPFKAFGIATQVHMQKHECNELSKTPIQKYFSLRKFLGWKATQVVLKLPYKNIFLYASFLVGRQLKSFSNSS